MTGPEHYREAERLAVQALDYEGLPGNHHIQLAQVAQVHAILAAAAATAMNGEHAYPHSGWPDGVAWYHAAGTKQPAKTPVTAGEDT